MSEKEKKHRAAYKKNRDKWIFVQSVIVGILTIAVLISSIVAYQLKKTYYIGYREGGNVDYNVFLNENEFYEDSYVGMNQSYVASLIDRILANFSYEIEMDRNDVNYRYSYSIKSRLQITDNSSSNTIFQNEEILINEPNKHQSSTDSLRINELVVIDYEKNNALASQFLSTYDLTDVTSSIIVTMNVDVLSDCSAFTGASAESYSSELRIPLTTKTVNIKMTKTVPDASSSMIACTRGVADEVFRTTAIVLGVIDVLFVLLLLAFIYLTRTEDITYTARVKRILAQYKSYIQKIQRPFDSSSYQVVHIDSFDELLEIRDTIQAPILFFENPEKTSAKFMIPTDSKLLYFFEIKIEGLCAEPSTPQPEPPKPEPPKARVQRKPTPPPMPVPENIYEEETAEEAEVCEEMTEAVCETVTETAEEETEELEEAEDVLALIPDAEEVENGVPAIDVFWRERPEKTYRYDPNGNDVQNGDTVLVPTRDVQCNTEIIREAEVSRGNYKVDPDTLEHPLKKIIGVVRRRAEKAFVAMITPEDTDSKGE